LIFALVVLVGLPTQSFSQSIDSYNLSGSGYSISGQQTQGASINLQLQLSIPTKATFEKGTFQLGDKAYIIKDLNLRFLKTDKFFRIDATSDDGTSIRGVGKLITSNDAGFVYDFKGQVTKGTRSEKVFFSAVLRKDIVSDVKEGPSFAAILPDDSKEKKDVMLLVKQTDRVRWKDNYQFTVRTFDPKTNYLSDFYQNWGYLEGVGINATIINPLGNIIKTSTGVTQKFGYFEGSFVIPENARLGSYVLNVTVSDDKFKTASKEMAFFVDPIVSYDTS
jgi:hypothetical protein